jgi:TonB family protein
MPEVLYSNEAAQTAVHDASGAVKLHTDANDHLDRLLAAEKAEIPWFLSLYYSIRELIKPEVLPPLEVTSKPVAVKDIWGLYAPASKNKYYSIGGHIAVFTLLMVIGTNPAVQQAVKKITLLDPNLRPYVPEVKKPDTQQGGGGQKSVVPPDKGQLPKPKPKQFVPPMNLDHTPKLVLDTSIIAPEDAILPQSNLPQWGDPLAKLTGTGGMGLGSGSGIGSGKGGGYGPGEGGGVGGGTYRVGGGVSAPTVLVKVDPEYSEEARKAKYSGSVLLDIIVDTEGKARDIRVAKSLGMGLDEKAIEAVQKWKFKPGMKAGQAVNVHARIEVNFRLL